MRIKAVSGVAIALAMIVGSALPASAQSLVDRTVFDSVRFSAASATVGDVSPAASLIMAPAVPRQGGSMTLNGIVLGGLSSSGDIGFAAGGGIQASNLSGREEFALQFDGLYSNNGGCAGCVGRS